MVETGVSQDIGAARPLRDTTGPLGFSRLNYPFDSSTEIGIQSLQGGSVRQDRHRSMRISDGEQIKRGAHRSTAALEAAIAAYIDARNADPKPFRWTKTADDILASIERFCHRTIAVQAQCG
jgi:hypothetical protein